jgi:Fic family protein
MDVEAIRNSPIGTIVPISGTDVKTAEPYAHHAFIPSPLPDELDLSQRSWLAVLEAEAALARLDQAAWQIPEPSLLRRPSLRREAQSTSALEGTYAPFEDVLESDVDEAGAVSAEVREVLNFITAAEAGFSWIADRPFSVDFLARLQRVLVADTPSEHDDAGRVRIRQVVVGARGASVRDSRFVPPPPDDSLRAGLDAWVTWLNAPPTRMPRVVRAALAHYQFETLHPFSDGNGRIGRLVIVLQLLRDGALREPILVVSPWLEAHRNEYQDGLLRLSQTGDWDAWVEFFAGGVAASADSTRVRIDELVGFTRSARDLVRASGISGVAERLSGDLIGAPILTASVVAKRYSVSHQGAMNALRRLVAAGLLRERTRANRVTFVCDRVVAILSR